MKGRTLLPTTLLLISAGLALSSDCSSRRQGTSYYAHETSCSLYHRCDSGHLETLNCPDGQFFNEELQTCDLAENVVCDKCGGEGMDRCMTFPSPTSTTTMAPCVSTPTCSIFDNGVRKTYPPECTKYIYCNMGQTEIKECPGNKHFSPTVIECMSIETANCLHCISL